MSKNKTAGQLLVMAERVTDAELLRRYTQSGDRDALNELARRYIDFVYAAARREMNGDASAADDITQATFLLLSQKAKQITHNKLGGWLFQTMRYCALNHRRSNRRRTQYELEAAAERKEAIMSPEASQHAALLPELNSAIASLSTTDREIVVRHFLSGVEVSQIAGDLELSEGATRKRLARAIDRLKSLFNRNGHSTINATGMIAILNAASADKAPTVIASGLSHLFIDTTAISSTITSISKGAASMMFVNKIIVLGTIILSSLLVAGVGVELTRRAIAGNTSIPSVSLPASSEFIGQLNDGTTVELVCLGEQTTGKWWKPDGTPIEKPPVDVKNYSDGRPPSAGTRFLYSVFKLGKADGTPISEIQNSPNTSDAHLKWVLIPLENGYWIEGLEVKDKIESISRQVNIKTNDWVDAANYSYNPTKKTWESSAIEPSPFGKIRLSNPSESKNKAQFDLELPEAIRNHPERFAVYYIADGHDGQQLRNRSNVVAHQFESTNKPGVQRLIWDRPMADLGRVLVGVEQFNIWVNFQNISLKPAIKTEVKISTTPESRFQGKLNDGTSVELICLFDQETGKWWKPDGTELENPPIKPWDWKSYPTNKSTPIQDSGLLEKLRPTSKPNSPVNRVVSVVYLPLKSDGTEAIGLTGNVSGKIGFNSNMPHPHRIDGKVYLEDAVELPRDVQQFSRHIAVSSQVVESIVKISRDPKTGVWDPGARDQKEVPGLGTFIVDAPHEEAQGAAFNILRPDPANDFRYWIRYIAKDSNGQPVDFGNHMFGQFKDPNRFTMRYSPRLSEVDSMEIARVKTTGQWVEFHDMPAYPGQNANLKVVRSDK